MFGIEALDSVVDGAFTFKLIIVSKQYNCDLQLLPLQERAKKFQLVKSLRKEAVASKKWAYRLFTYFRVTERKQTQNQKKPPPCSLAIVLAFPLDCSPRYGQ